MNGHTTNGHRENTKMTTTTETKYIVAIHNETGVEYLADNKGGTTTDRAKAAWWHSAKGARSNVERTRPASAWTVEHRDAPAPAPAAAVKITAKERAMLEAINGDQYNAGNGADTTDNIDCPVWTWSPCGEFGKSAGGIMASLVKKGLAGITKDSGHGEDDAACWITATGYAAIH